MLYFTKKKLFPSHLAATAMKVRVKVCPKIGADHSDEERESTKYEN
jgi:hypothetical protein